ncbi:MAG TPA: DUF305 domain-containing protein [Xanthomonadales bacterium]|nr:DUF305 domain-containing protein [Xanthomonadales bacterium]
MRELNADDAIRIAVTGYSPDDVRFMQDMIPHHQQALEMSQLAPDRTNLSGVLEAARRIEVSQQDEIKFMQQWLRARGQPVSDPAADEAMHHDHRTMAGMATPEQMAELAAAKGTDFDRMFLQLMITHHEGAVKMVKNLHEQPGSAFDPVLYEFTNDITNDQTAEIGKMNALLVNLSTDPRAGLSAGLHDAGIAILNLELLAALPRPPGFFDPDNPAELPPEKPATAEPEIAEDIPEKAAEEDQRAAMFSFANTDMAFSGDVLVAGSYHGFNVYRLGEGGIPALYSSVVCPGGQGDVSIVGDLLIMSVEQTRGRLDCGLQGITEDVSTERFRGIRIFDISDLQRPKQVAAVQTCRGSHTHSVVSGPGESGNIIVYVSGTSEVREQEEMESCFDEVPGDTRTALFRIDVIEIPVDAPEKARIVASPSVFADAEQGTLAGLWRGGDHGEDTQETHQTDQCHDITVFPELNLAAGACSGNGILFDIANPMNPQRLDAVVDTGFAYWHSATFNNAGNKVLFTDEWGGGSRPRCRAYDPITWGANAIYDIVDGKLQFRSHYKMPAPQVEEENCVAHNGSIIPVPGRDIFVQAWYQGGISIIDFTDSANPVEIAYFDRGPIDAEHLTLGGYWSSYWYQGRIYGTEIYRGLDVFRLLPSEHLSINEIAAAELADQGRQFNPQQQFQVTWPADPAVALAYLDQLQRDRVLPEMMASQLTKSLHKVKSGQSNPELAIQLKSLANELAGNSSDALAIDRLGSLNRVLQAIADGLE